MDILNGLGEEEVPNVDDQRFISVEMNEEVIDLSLKIATTFNLQCVLFFLFQNEQPTLKMELSCPKDFTFLKQASIDEHTYEELLACQKVSIPFNSFSAQFFSIIDKVNALKQSASSMFADLFTYYSLQPSTQFCFSS